MTTKHHIPMTAVKSSNVESHGYDATSKTLAVKFKSGGTYHYAGVPQEVADRMAKADNIGRFIGTDLKPHFTGVLQK
jgi:hypothetical protein